MLGGRCVCVLGGGGGGGDGGNLNILSSTETSFDLI